MGKQRAKRKKILLGNNNATKIVRSFRKDFNIAAMGWDYRFYYDKYDDDGIIALDDFCRTIQSADNELKKVSKKVELLLCAGLTIQNKSYTAIRRSVKNLSLDHIGTIVFEVSEKKSNDSQYVLFNVKQSIIKSFPSQIFSKSYGSQSKYSIKKGKASKLRNQLLKGNRSFSIGNRLFALIVCGENNIVKGNKKGKMSPLVAKWSGSLDEAKKISNLFKSSIVLNPAHTPYGINGRKRLEMMQNITNGAANFKYGDTLLSFNIPLYLHSNNFRPSYKVYRPINSAIRSKKPNGSFLFSSGKYRRTSFSLWQKTNHYSYILNTWMV